MAVLRIQSFAGSVPVIGDRAIPDNAAVDSVNTWLYGKELRGARPPTHVLSINPGIKKIFRVPKRNPGIPPSDVTANQSVWVQFTDPDTDVVKGQLVEDSYERYYFCSPTQGPRFNTYAGLLAGNPHYKLGVPGPDNTLDANGNNPNKPTITKITSQKKSDDLYEIQFRIAPSGGAPSYSNPGGMGDRTASIVVSGGTAQFDFGGTTSVANASHLINGNLTEAGFKFSDLTALNNAIVFDFTTARIIDEFRWLQDGSLTYGKWTLYGANTLPTYTELGSALLGGASDQPYVVDNTAAYRYYKLQQEPGSVIMTTCAYVYTWANQFGEESAPSLPVVGAGDSNGLWSIGNIKPPVALGSDYPTYTKKYLYRTLAGGTNDFYRVAEVPLATTTYIDDHKKMPDTELASNLPLESTYWQPPPDTLQGWVAMPNGFLVAFDKPVAGGGGGNNIYMSEAYHFHAWPPQYKYATETPVVGLGIIGQTCVVCTQGYPATVTGIKPATCAFTKATTGEPALSRGSIVSTPQGVIYASQNGLMQVGPNGIANVTETLITREEWLKTYIPVSLRAARFQDGYLAMRLPPSPAAHSGFFIDPTAIEVALTEFSDLNDITGIVTDFWSGEIFLLREGEIILWDPAPPPLPAPQPLMPVLWKSKEFQYLEQANFGAYAIYWDASRASTDPWGTDVLPVDEQVRLAVYADRKKVYDEEVPRNGRPVRLPSGFKADIWQFEIRARAPVYSLHVASTAKELRNV